MNNINFVKGIEIINRNMPPSAFNEAHYFEKNNKVFFGKVEWISDQKEIQLLEDMGWEKEKSWDEKDQSLYWYLSN